MNATGKWRIVVMALTIILACGTANAQHWRWYHRPHRVVTIVPKPVVTVSVSNRFTQKERFRMAMVYLKNHSYLTIKKYAKMTELPKAAAEAELDAFVVDRSKPIVSVIKGKKKLYVLRNRI